MAAILASELLGPQHGDEQVDEARDQEQHEQDGGHGSLVGVPQCTRIDTGTIAPASGSVAAA
jgi:hypothetical protein